MFCVYRDLGPAQRTIAKAGEIFYGKSSGKRRPLAIGTKWSSEHHWVQRCRDFDAYEDERRQAARAAAIVEMEERHVALAQAALAKAGAALDRALPMEFDLNDIIRWITEGAKLERLARGVPTARNELSGKDGAPVQVSLSVQELEDKVQALLRQAKGTG